MRIALSSTGPNAGILRLKADNRISLSVSPVDAASLTYGTDKDSLIASYPLVAVRALA